MTEIIETSLIESIHPECLICHRELTYNSIVIVSCCNTLYHQKCLHDSQAFHPRCPSCSERFYEENRTSPMLQRLRKHGLDTEEVHRLYRGLYVKGPKVLISVDKELRKVLKDQYPARLKGYFPIQLFEPNGMSLDSFIHRWDEFSYGIFRRFKWFNCILTGPSMDLWYTTTPDQPICLLISNRDYRVVRRAVTELLGYLALRIPVLSTSGSSPSLEAAITVKDHTITVYIPGLSREIRVEVDYHEHYFDIFSKREAYNMFYDGVTVYTTARGLAGGPSKPTPGCTMRYGETSLDFQKRCDKVCICGYQNFITELFGEYQIVFRVSPNLDTIRKYLLEKFSKGAICSLLDVRWTVDPSVQSCRISVESTTRPCENFSVFEGNLTEKRLMQFILESFPYQKKSLI